MESTRNANDLDGPHELLDNVKDQYLTGVIDRQEFLRYAVLLGMSVGAAASFLRMFGAQPAVAATGAEAVRAAVVPKRGGTYSVAMSVLEFDHPHRVATFEAANVVRQVVEFLTLTDKNNITHPYLLERWSVNNRADVWTLYLRNGISFTNGKALDADDVVWNFQSWLNPTTGSSVLGLIGPYLSADGIEKIDQHTVRLHLKSPQIAIPEYLFHYAAFILPKGWQAPNIKGGESVVGAVVGTGPFTLAEYKVGQSARVVRNPNYWQRGADGKPLPYLDAIAWSDLGGSAKAAALAAMRSGQIHSVYSPGPDGYTALRTIPGIQITRVKTIQTPNLEMRTDVAPFTDVKVRKAFKLLQARKETANIAYLGMADLGFDAHFGPADRDYAPKPIPKQDISAAKQLLASSQVWRSWGRKPLVLTAKNDTRFEPVRAEIFQREASQVGANVKIKLLPPSQYWPNWNTWPLSIALWGHRPLNTMVNSLTYTRDALPTKKNPAGYNNTRWVNGRFLTLLREANGTVDLRKRVKLISQMENIQRDEGSAGIALFLNVFQIDARAVRGNPGHPSDYLFGWLIWLAS